MRYFERSLIFTVFVVILAFFAWPIKTYEEGFIVAIITIIFILQIRTYISTGDKINKLGSISNKYLSYITSNYRKTSAPDFNILKDIVERHIRTLEEDINHTVAAPLYLGLIGTMIGVISGLLGLDFNLKKEIDPTPLIKGVKIAMLASICGLFFTVRNSTYKFNKERNNLEKTKNEFYGGLLNDENSFNSIKSNFDIILEGLKESLGSFNNSLDKNISKLEKIWDNVETSNKQQKEIVDAIKDIQIVNVVTSNVKIFKELNNSVNKLEKFNEYIACMSLFAEKFAKLEDLANATQSFQSIAINVNENMMLTKPWIEFINKNFEFLNEVKQKTTESVRHAETVVQNTMNKLDGAFTELTNHIEIFNEQVKDNTAKSVQHAETVVQGTMNKLDGAFTELTNHIKDFNELVKDNTAKSVQNAEQVVQNTMNKLDGAFTKLTNHIEHFNENVKKSIDDTIGEPIKDTADKIKGNFKNIADDLEDFDNRIKKSIYDTIGEPVKNVAKRIEDNFSNIANNLDGFDERVKKSIDGTISSPDSPVSIAALKIETNFKNIAGYLETFDKKISDSMEEILNYMEKLKGGLKSVKVEDFLGKELDNTSNKISEKIEEITKKETLELSDRLSKAAQNTELENLMQLIYENTKPRSGWEKFKIFFGYGTLNRKQKIDNTLK